MPPADNAVGQPRQPSIQTIQRVFWIVLGILLAVLLGFAGYYLRDRYFHADSDTPAESSIAHLEDAVREQPQEPLLRITLAESYLRAGEYAAALEQAGQVLDQYPDNVSALLIAGVSHIQLDQPEAAVELLRRFVALRKDGPMARSDTALEAAYYYLGESYLKLGRPAEAIPHLEEALRISPVDADALYQLGLALDATGQPELAVQRYGEAVRLVPDFLEVYRAMAGSYSALDRPDYVVYAQGMVAFCREDYQTATTYLQQATQSLPDYAPAFLGLGLTYESKGELEAALAAIQRALDLDPGDLAARQALTRIQAAPEMQN